MTLGSNNPGARLDESGMTLVEVLIAAGLTIIIALAVSSLFVEMTRQQEQTKEKADIFSMQQQLTYDLKYKPLPTSTP